MKFNYDGRGHTYVDNDKFNQLIHDCEPGAPKGRVWYETGVINTSDLCNVPGHENSTGYNIIYGSSARFSVNTKIA